MNENDIRKKRQSEVSKAGGKEEFNVIKLLLSNPFIEKYFNIGKCNDVLDHKEPLLMIAYGKIEEKIDADICVVQKKIANLFV